MSRLSQEAPFWVAIVLSIFAFKAGWSLRQGPIPAADDPARLLAAAEYQFQHPRNWSKMRWSVIQSLYYRVLRIQPLNIVARERLVAMDWNAYQYNLMLHDRSISSLLTDIVHRSVLPGFSNRPTEDTFLIAALAEIELSRLAADASQSWRWLEKAEETVQIYARSLPDSGGGASRLASLKFLDGRAQLQRYVLGQEPDDLKSAIRNLWASRALDPTSLANRYYLACALRIAGTEKSALEVANSMLRLPDSPRQFLEGPSSIYRRRVHDLLSAKKSFRSL